MAQCCPILLSNIGGEIDFLILDTAHTLPGEILDFLLALPYLAPNAIVVLHDIALPLLVDSPMSCATSILLESVHADKYLPIGDDCPGGVDNIGAFTVIPDTMSSVANVFFALLKRWRYGLTDEQLKTIGETLCVIMMLNACICLRQRYL